MKFIIYKCNPEKNKNCPRINCKFNYQDRSSGLCEGTIKPEYAELDEEGKPIVLDVFDSEIIPERSKQ